MERVAISVMEQIANSRGLRIAIWVSVILFLVSALLQLPGIIFRYVSPYVVTEAEALHSPIPVGSNAVIVAYTIDRRRTCKVDIDWFVRALETSSVVARVREPGGAVSVGHHEKVLNTIRIPTTLTPGCYEISTTIVNECAEGQHSTAAPPAKFCVSLDDRESRLRQRIKWWRRS